MLPHRTVVENVAYGLKIRGIPKDAAKSIGGKWIDRVGLTGFQDHFPSQLSGGMQQRVGLARALATDAEILLMDEAFSALDPLIRANMQNILLDLQQELHKTIVFITHDLDEALRIGDRISILRDGVVVQDGTSQEIILAPADEYVSDFIRDINRARVLKVGSIMKPSKCTGGPNIDKDMVIEDALHALARSDSKTVTVVDGGKVLGTATFENMMFAIARQNVARRNSEDQT